MKQALKEVDKWIYGITMASILVLVGLLAVVPDTMLSLVESLYTYVVDRFGWMYIFISAGCFALFLFLYFSKYGNIKLGKPDTKPRFSTFSWAAMIFTSGAGSSTIILGFSEPLYYLTNPPFHITPMSNQAFEYAHMYGQFHWGLSAWAFYVPAVAGISYMLYLRGNQDVKLSASMTPLFGARFPRSPLGRLLDILVAFGIVASITTSLGLGVPVMSTLIADVTGLPADYRMQLGVFAIWFCIFGWSVFRGLDRGIRQLTNVNMVLIAVFLAAFVLVTPLGTIINMQLNSIGLYLDQLPRMVFYTDPFGDRAFVTDWTLFYWGWWLIFIPIMGIFIAKISEGRTLKQVLLGQMVWGSLGCCAFLGLLGGYSLYLQHNGIVDLVSILAEQGNEGAVLAIMHTLPFSKVAICLLIALCFVFLATTIDSTAIVLGSATSKKLNPQQDPHLYNRFSWALAIFILSIGLSFVGGLELVQKFAILLGFPLIFVTLLLALSTLKALEEDYGAFSKAAIVAQFSRLSIIKERGGSRDE